MAAHDHAHLTFLYRIEEKIMRQSVSPALRNILICLAALGFWTIPTSSNAESVSPSRLPTAIIPHAYFGMHFHRLDRGTKWPGREIGTWRLWDTRVTWVDIEPQPGVWNFSQLDRYVSMGQSAGAELDYVLGMSPPWASSRPEEKGVYSKNKKG